MKDLSINEYLEYQRQSSMLYWWDKIKDLPIPKPTTVILQLTSDELSELAGYRQLSEDTKRKVLEAVQVLRMLNGDFPIFIRTDHFSSKHHYVNTCFVPNEKVLFEHIKTLINDADNAGFFGLPTEAIAFRRFIEPNAPFRAFHGLPIAKERRYMVRDGKVVQHFPYWPKDAIRFYKPWKEPERWQEKLAEINKENDHEIALLTQYATMVGKKLAGYWSVDFMQSKSGEWYLIDMARGEVSWTPNKEEEE